MKFLITLLRAHFSNNTEDSNLARWRNIAFVSVISLCIAQGGQAATLGDIKVLSALGDRFSAQIPVTLLPGEEVSGSCFRITRPAISGDDDTAILGAASLRLLPVSDDLAMLQIRGAEFIQEPLVKLAIRMRCPGTEGHAFQREYSVLLDPRDYSSYGVQESRLPPAVQSQLQPRESSSAARRIPPRGGTWLTRDGDTVASIARRYATSAGKSRQDFIQQLYDLNPDLPQSANARLAADLAVRIPDASQAAIPAAVSTPVRAVAEAPAPLRLEEKPSLSLGAAPAAQESATYRESGSYALQLSAPELGAANGTLTPEQALLLREQLLALDSDDQAAQTLQLKYQVSQLQKQLAELRQRQQDVSRVEETQAGRPAYASWSWLWLPLALLMLMPVGFVFWRRRQIREQASSDAFTAATMTTAMSRLPAKQVERGEMNTQMPDYASLAGFDINEIAVPIHRPASDDWHSSDNIQMDVVQPGNVGEEAQLLLDHGLSQQAINLLLHEIQAYPAALALWMKLFSVYVQQDMKDAFQERAVAFRLQFSSDSMWQQVQEMGRQIDPANPLYRSLDVQQEEHFTMLQASLQAPVQVPAPMDDALFASAMHDQAGLPRPLETVVLGAAVASNPAMAVHDDEGLDFSLDDAVEQELTATAVAEDPAADALDFAVQPAKLEQVFVSDDPAMQGIARLIAAGQRDEAMTQLELMLYKGSMEQKLQAAKWVDLLAPVLPPGTA